MHLVMFDIDGTLVQSYDFDSECYQLAILDVLGIKIDADWTQYQNVTDSGILSEIIEKQSLQDDHQIFFDDVKKQFIRRVKNHIASHEVLAVEGAANLLSQLDERQDVAISLATGGWSETARLKLEAAGINHHGIPLSSSCDHYSRIEIMRIAEALSGEHAFKSKTYFGDGPWDQKASQTLGYNFVAVGDRTNHPKKILDYTDVQLVFRYIGL
jgi:beta-phosphoglucomutase-like phosphatase (HAD superfamily)